MTVVDNDGQLGSLTFKLTKRKPTLVRWPLVLVQREPRALIFPVWGRESLKCGLHELLKVSLYMLDEPFHVDRPVSHTEVQQSLPPTISVAD